MKTNVLLIVLCVLFLIIAGCKKSKLDSHSSPTLSGKWAVVNDTTAYGAAIIQTNNYIGIAGDYFDFRTDGNCYTKEGARYDTLAYNMVTDSTVSIASFNFGYPNTIRPFTLTSASIYHTGGPYNPGGISYRMVNLKK